VQHIASLTFFFILFFFTVLKLWFLCLCGKSAHVFKAAVIWTTLVQVKNLVNPLPPSKKKKKPPLHTHICPATHYLFISHRLNIALLQPGQQQSGVLTHTHISITHNCSLSLSLSLSRSLSLARSHTHTVERKSAKWLTVL